MKSFVIASAICTLALVALTQGEPAPEPTGRICYQCNQGEQCSFSESSSKGTQVTCGTADTWCKRVVSEEGDILLGCASHYDMQQYELKCQDPDDDASGVDGIDKVCFCEEDLCNGVDGLSANGAAVLAVVAAVAWWVRQ